MPIVLIISLFFNSVFAADCNSPKSHSEFFSCSLERHPEFEISKLKSAEADAALSQASQWQNPELEFKSTSGRNAGKNVSGAELSLSIPVSQIWTRSAKKNAGKAEQQVIQIESTERLLEVQKSLLKDIFRLRQIEDETEITAESIRAFDRIKSQLRSRKARGPEQEITLNLVDLASSDYDLKLNALNIEKSEITSRLKALWSPEFKIEKRFLPPLKSKWPQLSKEASIGQSLHIRRTAAQAERARAEHRLADSESWPALSVGPTVERSKDGETEFTSYGVNANLTLPLFSLNGGSRRLAETRSRQAELNANYAIKRAELEKGILIERYQSSVNSLVKYARHNDSNKKHAAIDSLFERGLASGSIIIEAHRQISEFTESQHKNELTALDAYLEIKTLSGDANLEEISK